MYTLNWKTKQNPELFNQLNQGGRVSHSVPPCKQQLNRKRSFKLHFLPPTICLQLSKSTALAQIQHEGRRICSLNHILQQERSFQSLFTTLLYHCTIIIQLQLRPSRSSRNVRIPQPRPQPPKKAFFEAASQGALEKNST